MRHEELKTLAAPFLRAMEGKIPEAFGIATIDERRAVGVVLYSIKGPDRFSFNTAEGFAFPLHTSAPGKAFVAALPEKRLSALLKRMTFKRYTANTITNRTAFEAEIERVRTAGFATDFSEETEGCHCGGVAVLGPDRTPVASLWVTGMAKRLADESLLVCVRHLQEVAAQIEAALAEAAASAKKKVHLSPWVVSAQAAIDAQPCGNIDYAALAKASGVSYSTLRASFRTELGTTLGQYQLRMRLAEAQRLLTQSDLTITQIADRTGFCNQKHFSALFKRKIGQSPLSCRKKSR